MERAAAPTLPAQQTGTLWLEVQPQVPVQFLVDDAYVGTSDELGFGLELEPGNREIELRAEGFEPLHVKVRITAARSLRYQAMLRASFGPATPPGPAAVAPAPMTVYVIPGCYAGNVPPQDVRLPEGCDRSLATTLVR